MVFSLYYITEFNKTIELNQRSCAGGTVSGPSTPRCADHSHIQQTLQHNLSLTGILWPCSGSSLQATTCVRFTPAMKSVLFVFAFLFQEGHWPQFVKVRQNNCALWDAIIVMWHIGNVCRMSLVNEVVRLGRSVPLSLFRQQTEDSSVSTLACV